MSTDQAVSDHYRHGDLLNAIHDALAELGKAVDSVTIDDLAPVDEFHIGGRVATETFLDQLGFSGQDHVLDVGCGLGGAARYVASRHGSRVTGLDVTPEYVETGNTLCAWVQLHESVSLHAGSALAMPFADASFDGGYMMHVGMNIADKGGLFAEIHRVLRPGATFGVYDVMRHHPGELAYPVPWAAEQSACSLATPDEYKQALAAAGFAVASEVDRRDFALEFFRKLREKTEAEGGPPPLGLHTLMKDTTALKIKNMIANITADYVAPVEIIATKPG